MNKNETLERAQIFEYRKSGRLAAFFRDSSVGKITVVDLDRNMRELVKIRTISNFRGDSLMATPYVLEFLYTTIEQSAKGPLTQIQLVRVLTTSDLEPQRWHSDRPIKSLLLSPTEFITAEELIWAGKREGNVASGLLLAGSAAFFWWWGLATGEVFPTPFAIVLTYFSLRFSWQRPTAPDPERLLALKTRKKELATANAARQHQVKSEFLSRLADFDSWARMTPKTFEHALQMKLEEQGFTVETTRYSSDGGVDIEGYDESGRAVVVQAKQYKGRVGVGVVRDMIGVREIHNGDPRVMIYSLVGFTKGAHELASAQNIELRDIRTDILKLGQR